MAADPALALWALWRSTHFGRNFSDVGVGARLFGMALVAILAVAFVELQPWVLFKMTHPSDEGSGFAGVSSLIKVIAGFGTVVGFLGRFLADVLKRLTEKPGFAAFASRIAIKFAMYVAGAAVPLLLWAAYLKLSFWPHPLVIDYGTEIVRNAVEVALPGLGILLLLAFTAIGVCRRSAAGRCCHSR